MKLKFRAVLTLSMLGVAGLAAVPAILAEARRPWDELGQLVHTAEGVLATTMAALPEADREAMARFARAHLETGEVDAASFVALIAPGEGGSEGPIESKTPASPWAAALAADPAAAAAFARSWPVLAAAREAAGRAGLNVDDIYLTLDDGIKPGFFQDHLAFVLGSHPADESPIAPGEGFNVTAIDGVFWRASYLPELGGSPGRFGQNPTRDPVLPRFETDEWGSWYSVWLSERVPGGYVALTMDIEASAVRTAMISAAQRSALLLALLLLLAVVVARYISGRISRPVAALRDGALAVAAERYDHRVKVQGPLEVAELIKEFNLMTGKLAERVNLLQTLEKMLSKELAAAAARDGLRLGGEEAECSVLFTDFANFSGTTESMRATEIVGTLNAYFSVLIPIIKRNGGFVDKYIGDAIVAFFGAPIPLADHADRAVRCAVELQRAVRTLNEERRAQGLPVFLMRAGVNSGEVVVGAIGCDEKLEYTSIGETTTLAQRMETACTVGEVCIAAGTRQALREPLPDGVTLDAEAPVRVKGYADEVLASRLWIDRIVNA